MNTIDLTKLAGAPDLSRPTPLYSTPEHAVYWLGIIEDAAFRCNSYLVVDQHEAILIDPGSRAHFDETKRRVSQILPPERVTGVLLCHQDPDVAASLPDWLRVNPQVKVFTSLRTNVLLPYYGTGDYRFVDVGIEKTLKLASGAELNFIAAPFLHFSGAFTTYDSAPGFLFSGDIWAAVSTEWSLVVENFQQHATKMDMFHIDYMASNVAARGFVRSLKPFAIKAILPQHGSIIASRHVKDALEYLDELECGTDVIYPDLAF